MLISDTMMQYYKSNKARFEITSIVSIQLPGRAITIFEMVTQSFIKTDPDLPGILSGHLPCSPLRETVCPVMWFERCTANVVWTLHGTCCTAAHAEDSLQISHSKVFYLGIWPRFALRETLPLGQLSLLHIPPTHLNTWTPMYLPTHLNTYLPTYTPTYLHVCCLPACPPYLHMLYFLWSSHWFYLCKRWSKMFKKMFKDVQKSS